MPLKVYDETIKVLKYAVVKARLGQSEQADALKRLDSQSRQLEKTATGPSLKSYVAEEWRRSPEYGGRTVFDDAAEPFARAKKR